jgi:hypothetical protein
MAVSFVADNVYLSDSRTLIIKICFKQKREAERIGSVRRQTAVLICAARAVDLGKPDELRRAHLAGASPLPGSTSRDEALRAILVQNEFWDGPNHVRITHQREADVFLLKDVSQDDDPNIFMGQACLQQRNVLHDRIVLAIAAMALQRLEGRAPMVRHAPLRLSGWA